MICRGVLGEVSAQVEVVEGVSSSLTRPGHGPRMSVAFGAMYLCSVSPLAGTRKPPVSLPLTPPFAPLYGYFAVIGAAKTWFALNGHVASLPGPDPGCWRSTSIEESTSGTRETHGKALAASASMRTVVKNFILANESC